MCLVQIVGMLGWLSTPSHDELLPLKQKFLDTFVETRWAVDHLDFDVRVGIVVLFWSASSLALLFSDPGGEDSH